MEKWTFRFLGRGQSKGRLIFAGFGLVCISLFFYFVFSGVFLLPQELKVGFVTIRYYGITMAVAVFASLYYLRVSATKFSVRTEALDRFASLVILAGFVGARAYHVLSSFGYYQSHLLQALYIWQGGLSIYGALIGGVLAVLYILHRYRENIFYINGSFRFNLLLMLDWLAPGVLIGQVIGRLGNLYNYEAYGYPTNLPWKMYVPEAFRNLEYLSFNFFHPFFLYEALGNLIIFYFLVRVVGKPKKAGVIFFSYLALYNLLRMCLEFLRIDSTFLGSGYRLNVLVSLGLALVALLGLCWLKRQEKANI